MDQIIIKGLRVRGRHGTTMQEMTFGQEFEVDITLDCDLSLPCQSDKEEDAPDKQGLIQCITRVIDGEHCDTPEHLAQRIADRLIDAYPQVQRVELLLQQPQAPIHGDFDYVGVKIIRP